MSTDRTRVRLGEARTPAEHAAEACLAAVDEWRDREVYYGPVFGGLQNSNWCIDVAGDSTRYFLKVPGAGTEEFIDRGNSNVAAIRAGQLGISPRVVHYDAETGVEISEFLEGYRACNNGDMKTWEVAESVIRLQSSFHEIDSLPVTKTIFDLIDEHVDQVRSLGVRTPGFFTQVLREYEAAREAFIASGLDIVPCHNDPMPGNFLVDAHGGPMKLVDFEYASNNERAYDLAVTFTEYFFDEPTVLRCVELVYGNTSPSVVARAQVASALADIKWGLWGLTYHQINTTWDFDYHKYGVWKLLRGRHKIADLRWGQWLGAL